MISASALGPEIAVSFVDTPSKRHVQAELSTSMWTGLQSANGDNILDSCNEAKDEAKNVQTAAMNVANVEMMRKNEMKCWRSFCRGLGGNANTIKPKIPDNINWKDKRSLKLFVIEVMSKCNNRAQPNREKKTHD